MFAGQESQWCSLRDADWLTLLEDVVVPGVGSDGAYAHREYAATHNIRFPLLSDFDRQVSRAYGVLTVEFEEHRDAQVAPRSSSIRIVSSSLHGRPAVPTNTPTRKRCRRRRTAVTTSAIDESKESV